MIYSYFYQHVVHFQFSLLCNSYDGISCTFNLPCYQMITAVSLLLLVFLVLVFIILRQYFTHFQVSLEINCYVSISCTSSFLSRSLSSHQYLVQKFTVLLTFSFFCYLIVTLVFRHSLFFLSQNNGVSVSCTFVFLVF